MKTTIEFKYSMGKHGKTLVIENAAPSIIMPEAEMYCIDQDSGVITETFDLTDIEKVTFETEV